MLVSRQVLILHNVNVSKLPILMLLHLAIAKGIIEVEDIIKKLKEKHGDA